MRWSFIRKAGRSVKNSTTSKEEIDDRFGLREEISDKRGICAALRDHAWLYHGQGDYAEMLAVSSRAARLAEEINAPEELWSAQDDMGRAFLAMGRPDEARRSFLAAISAIETLRRQVAGGEQQQQSFLENMLVDGNEAKSVCRRQRRKVCTVSSKRRATTESGLSFCKAWNS